MIDSILDNMFKIKLFYILKSFEAQIMIQSVDMQLKKWD